MPPSPNPYVGPRPFEAADAEFFFGRDREISDLVALIVSNPVVLLYAASGAGKSSLLNAAVIAKLEREQEFDVLPVARVRGLHDRGTKPGGNVYIEAVLSHIANGTPLAPSVRDHLAASERGQTSDGFAAARALVVDQLEEVFTAYPERWSERPAFFEDLARAVRDDPLLRVVLSIREDFVAQIDPYARLFPDGLQARYRLERLSAGAALRAAREPAKRAGRPFANDVAEALVEDLQKVRVDTERGPEDVVGEFVEPVQLQVACRSVWEALPDSATEITEEHRQQFGNVNEVLGAFYDSAIAAAATAAHRRERTMRSRFAERFITASGTRGTVFWTRDETGGIPAPAIKELEDRHVIRAEIRAGGRWYELTHDRLIEPVRVSNREYVQRRNRWRAQVLSAGAIAVVAVAASIFAVAGRSNDVKVVTTTRPSRPNRLAERELLNTRSQLALAYARTNAKTHPQSYVSNLAVQSITFTSESEIVVTGFDDAGATKALALPSGGVVVPRDVSAYVARTGASLIAFSDGRLVLRRGAVSHVVTTDLENTRSIALSPGGEYSAAIDRHGVRVFNGARHITIGAATDAVFSSIAFSQTGQHVLLSDTRGALYVADSKLAVRVFGLPTGFDRGIAVSGDGRQIAAYGSGATALIDESGDVVGGFPGKGAVAAAFSPSGRWLAIAYQSGAVHVWQTLPDLTLEHLAAAKVGSRSRLSLNIANIGLSSSRPTPLTVQGARVTAVKGSAVLKTPSKLVIPAILAGRHMPLSLDVAARETSIKLVIAHSDAFGEQDYENNAVTILPATGRGGIVAAALAAAAKPDAVKFDDSTLAATNDGALRHVHLPELPRTATSTGFATWCYYAAGAADPNKQHFLYPSQRFLRQLGKQVATPKLGDLVFFTSRDLGPAVAVFVGKNHAVTFVKKKLARVPLLSLGPSRTYRTYLLR